MPGAAFHVLTRTSLLVLAVETLFNHFMEWGQEMPWKALMAVVLPKALIALILMAWMFPLQYMGILIVAVEMVVLGKKVWKQVDMEQQSKTIIIIDVSS